MFENLFAKTPQMKVLIESLEKEAIQKKLTKLLDIFEIPTGATMLVETELGYFNFVTVIDNVTYFQRANIKGGKWRPCTGKVLSEAIKKDILNRSVSIPNKNPAPLSEQLKKTDEINLVLWGKQDSVRVCKTEYPSQYSKVVANLSNHMDVVIHEGYLVLSRKG